MVGKKVFYLIILLILATSALAAYPPEDLNKDCEVNILDLILTAKAIGTQDLVADFKPDGEINVFDLILLVKSFDKTCTDDTPQSEPAPNNLVASYSFNAGDVRDDSGNSNTGTISGVQGTTGKYSQGFLFDGTNDNVRIPDSSSINPSSWTIAAWFKVDSLTNDGAQNIISKGDGTNVNYMMDFNQPENTLRCLYKTNGVWVEPQNPSKVINPGKWHFGACTYDAGNKKIKVYLDGVLVQTSESGLVPPKTSSPVYFGQYTPLQGATDNFNGVIDEVRIYNKALSTSEIQQAMNSPINIGSPPPSCSCGSWSNNVCSAGSCSSTQMQQTRSCTPDKCNSESRCVADTSCNAPPSCSCGSWQNNVCGGGSCSSTQMQQTRSCTPDKCNSETRCITSSTCNAPPPSTEKPRIFVLTDIGPDESADLDDTQSLIRFMLYSNEFEVEGLVATFNGGNLCRPPEHECPVIEGEPIRADYIENVVNAYGQVRNNLLLHKSGYPTKSYLQSLIKEGHPKSQLSDLGSNADTAGSNWIIKKVDESSKPLHVVLWGGSFDLAQALWRVKRDRTTSQVNTFVSKIRVYADGGSYAKTGIWIRNNFPNIFWVNDGPTANDDWTWNQKLMNSPYRGYYSGGDTSTVSQSWTSNNVANNHGPLGAIYPIFAGGEAGVKEAHDWFGILPWGMHDPTQPTWGGWGGRFGSSSNPKHFFSTAKDTVSGETSGRATVFRWREQFQNDFQARMDWNVKNYANANHNPVVNLRTAEALTVNSGETVTLDATGSSDPDENSLSYKWWYYKEPGTYSGSISISNSNSAKATFKAPTVSSQKKIHIILEVKDNGNPQLTSYERVFVKVNP